MATLFGVNAQLRENEPSEKVPVGDFHGVRRMIREEVTLDAASTDSDQVLLGPPIPKGARILELKGYLRGTGPTAGAGTIGNLASVETDEFDVALVAEDLNSIALLAGTEIVAATTETFFTFAPGVALMTKLAAEVQMVFDIATTFDANTAVVHLELIYVVD